MTLNQADSVPPEVCGALHPTHLGLRCRFTPDDHPADYHEGIAPGLEQAARTWPVTMVNRRQQAQAATPGANATIVDTLTTHQTEVLSNSRQGVSQASCACGWTGPNRTEEVQGVRMADPRQAKLDAGYHVRDELLRNP